VSSISINWVAGAMPGQKDHSGKPAATFLFALTIENRDSKNQV
jgi:hypothetical protein